ncbi:MAG: hypothetical protein MUF81_04695, partial [Verrucomicrobia bacterium]|nr:hypothetical protein [Verrucomicrobiota bacterium]
MKTLNQITGKLVAVIFVLSSINASGRPREPWPPLPEFAPVLYHESFDEVYSYCTTNAYWVVPDYGTLIESWSGYALERAGDVTPFVVPGLDAAGHTNITAEGALRFWVKPYWSSAPDGKGPGKDARLVELLAVGNKQVLVIFSLQVNADGTVLSLVSESDKGPMNLMKSEICWPAGQWHQVVLNHGPKATTLHVDGELVGESEPVLTLPPQAAALVWGSTADGTDSFEGEFEELYTFSKPLEVALYYSAFKNQAALGPISLEEEKALAEAAARWRAEHKSEGGGSEMRLLVGGTSECITNVPVYITNLVAFFDTNQGWTVTFDIQGSYDGTTTALYDVFTTTNLVGDNGTNSQWVWLERGPSCSTYQYTNQAEAVSFYLVGTPLDSDGDGFTDAYERLVSHSDPNVPDAPVILFQPLSQTVEQGDTATFTVIADGAQPLSYQWLRGGTNIVGETNNWLTFTAVDSSQADDYSVQVTSSAALSTLSSNATLMVQYADNWPLVTVVGPRQDYTFKNGTTYYIDSRVELYGTTTIEGGAIIKPAWYYPDSTLAIMGKLVCKTEDAYFPAFITSVDDDTVGDAFYDSSGTPEAISNGVPYLDLTFAQDASPALDNLRIRYADQGVGTPTNKRLNVWNCQFVGCNSAVIANKDATVSFHNVLFGDCGTAVAGATNFTAIEGEHVTADVTNFWTQVSPTWIKLTNSLVIGTLGSGPTFVTDHSAINPSGSVFQPAGSGRYYLTNTSSYVRTGTTNISPRLLTEFRQKTTQPPLIFPEMLQIAGDLTLGQQVARYTNGAPDYGYYYPALDYTVAWMTVRGNITMLPGTAIGFRSEYSAALGHDTWWGFDMREGSSFSSRGTPSRPNIFTDVQMVQEQLASACIASFVPDFWPNDSGNVAPSLDFRFSNFYANSHWYHAWSGYDAAIQYLFAPDSLVNWNMRDCNLHGGRITLGQPDDGSFYGAPPDWFYGACAVSWVNNLFDGVAIDLDPTFYRFDLGMNCDMAFEAYNNLFRGGLWFHLEPIPATAGNWVFKDNLFDKVDFVQNTNAPLDFNYNGYWPLSASELNWAWYSYPWYDFNSGQLLVTTNGGGGNEQVMAVAPEYQNGVFGNHYLPITSALYGAGSRAPGDAGLAQYTTRVDQTKEGDETTGHMVNIGLHYVVAGTNSVPKDFDGDGIPDFVEDANGSGQWDEGVETKIDNAYTTTGVLDSTNSIYDDVDLDGDDLTGRAERILVTSPLIADNPLTLTPVITGEEPFILTYSIPLSGDVSTNRCMLALLDNGVAAGGYEFIQQSNNTYQVKWNTTFAPNALHFLQVELVMPGSRLPKNIPGAQPVLFVHGP